jgi:hypothetical protein
VLAGAVDLERWKRQHGVGVEVLSLNFYREEGQ